MKTVKLITSLVAVFGLSACLSSVLPEPAPADTIYRLLPQKSAVEAQSDATIIRIDRPSAPKALMGQDVILSPDGRRLAAAALARWSEPLPAMIQRSFFDELSSREILVGVLPTSGARTDMRAHLTVRNFEAEFDQGEQSAPLATVQYTVTLSDAGSRKLLGTFDVRKTIRAGSTNVSAIIRAQDTANAAAMSDIADWLERQVHPNKS